jgi:hypothetical protein
VSYSFDTSGLMDGWRRYYPPDVFPSLWERIDTLGGTGEVFFADQVRLELQAKDDDLFEWVNGRRNMCRPLTEDIQRSVEEILTLYRDLVDPRATRDFADPFVIAAARVADATVVTGEKPTRAPDRPKIPNVCEGLGVDCIDILEFIRRQGWTF